MSQAVNRFVKQPEERFLGELQEFIRIPSISTLPEYDAGMRRAAHFVAESMKAAGRETVFTRSGGSIPIVGDFSRHLGIPTILMGLGLPDDGLHSPNEKFRVDNFYLGIRTVAGFLEKFGQTRSTPK
jgi:acetylornithine deacetylase/succinyl-diaminopimelate desuccinylase-like protein